MENILKIDKIEKYYGNKSSLTKAIDNLSFDVEKGEFVAIMGASGSGKTTLLNCISTIDKVTSGHIYVAENDITKLKGNSLNEFRREELGFIFQDFNLLDTLTAYENIALALSIQNVNSREIDTRIKKVAKELDIVNVLNKYPYQMSGGQKQRVASARAIITNPKLILADEPTGALDSKSAKMLLEKFDYLNKELQATILMVTHDAFTASYSSRVIFIKDGKIVNEKHFNRISGLIDNSKVVLGGASDADSLRIEPTIMDNVTFDDAVMQEEIFGPLMPILTFHSVEEAVNTVNAHMHPLALYIFTKNKKEAHYVTSRCNYGGGCINDTIIHLATSNMGFGGFGESGMGSYHGKAGFDTFSHYKSIVDKKCWLDLPMRYQPYTKTNNSLIHMFLK